MKFGFEVNEISDKLQDGNLDFSLTEMIVHKWNYENVLIGLNLDASEVQNLNAQVTNLDQVSRNFLVQQG